MGSIAWYRSKLRKDHPNLLTDREAREKKGKKGFVKLTDFRLFSAFLHNAKPLKLHIAAIRIYRDFVVNPVNLTKPYRRLLGT